MITKVQMINCQSWKNSAFTLATDRINAIIADNGTGKSVFMKMLKITACPKYFDRYERKKLIRNGAEFASICFEFDDGGIACTRVYPTYTIYMYKPADADTIQTSYEPSPEMLKQVGLIANSNSDFVANIVDTDQDLLLVNSKLKNNYELVSLLVKNPLLESAKEHLDEALVKILTPYSSICSKREFLDKQIKESAYCDVREREIQLQRVESAVSLIQDAIQLYNLMLTIGEVLDNYLDFESIEKTLEVLELTEGIDLESLQIGVAPINLDKELDLLEKVSEINIGDLRYTEEPASVDKELNFLDILYDLAGRLDSYASIKVKAVPDIEQHLNLLELLRKIDVDSIKLEQQPQDISSELALLDQLLLLQNEMVAYEQQQSVTKQLQSQLLELQKELLNSGETVECPIHGKVIFNGEDCIPYSV